MLVNINPALEQKFYCLEMGIVDTETVELGSSPTNIVASVGTQSIQNRLNP